MEVNEPGPRILLGVALFKVASPPLTDKTKSLIARSPLAVPLLYAAYTASLIVTFMVVLSEAIDEAVIVGNTFSLRLTVLLLCDVDEAVPLAS